MCLQHGMRRLTSRPAASNAHLPEPSPTGSIHIQGLLLDSHQHGRSLRCGPDNSSSLEKPAFVHLKIEPDASCC